MSTTNCVITIDTVNVDHRDSARDGNLAVDSEGRLKAILEEFFTGVVFADGA